MPEYFDVYDEDGKQTGEKVERGEVHRRGLWHQVVHVWLINPYAGVLLGFLSPESTRTGRARGFFFAFLDFLNKVSSRFAWGKS
jgi:hypothetical protein